MAYEGNLPARESYQIINLGDERPLQDLAPHQSTTAMIQYSAAKKNPAAAGFFEF
jgi:hypothetical protein